MIKHEMGVNLSHIVEGAPEVGAEAGLLRMTISYTKGNRTVHARDWLMTPHQALRLAKELERHAVLMAAPAEVVQLRRRRKVAV
jgi:hypothetical protein